MQLRPYQQRAVNLLLSHIENYPDATPIGWLPTGSGKSVVAGALATEMVRGQHGGAALIVTHRRELVAQNASKLPHHVKGSIFSAGLGKKDLSGQVIFASIQSLAKHAHKLPRLHGIVIDEPQYAAAGYYDFVETVKQFSPQVRTIGLTATPYTGNGTWLYMTKDKRLFTGIAAEVGLGELLQLGHLAPLTPYLATAHVSTEGARIDSRTGDYSAKDLQALADVPDLVIKCAIEIESIFAERNSVLVFCTGIAHTEHMAQALGAQADVVTSKTSTAERDRIIGDFRSGKLKYLCSCEVVLVGFDATNTDGIACLRPTTSPLIWVQLLGRGMRPHPGKADCLVADFTDNSIEFPPVDEIEGHAPKDKLGDTPTKVCDECFSLILAGLQVCPVCGHDFPPFQHHEAQLDPETGLLISGVIKNEDGSRTYPVSDVTYDLRATRAGAWALVAYYHAPGRKSPVAETWYNLFHHTPSVASGAGTLWMKRALMPGIPHNPQDALARAEMGGLKTPRTVTIKPGSPFPIRMGA